MTVVGYAHGLAARIPALAQDCAANNGYILALELQTLFDELLAEKLKQQQVWKTWDGEKWNVAATFPEAMEKHFAGWNPPRRTFGDVMESFEASHRRVNAFYKGQNEQWNTIQDKGHRRAAQRAGADVPGNREPDGSNTCEAD